MFHSLEIQYILCFMLEQLMSEKPSQNCLFEKFKLRIHLFYFFKLKAHDWYRCYNLLFGIALNIV